MLSKYFPNEVFRQDPGWKGINADRTSDKVISKIPELTFVQEYYDVEISSGKFEPTMEQLLQHMVDVGKISKSEMKSRVCSDEILTYFWVIERDPFRDCTSTMKFISNFGSGVSYPFRSGFDIGQRGYAWKIALKGFYEDPIFGIGPENFPILHYKYLEESKTDDSPHFDRAHNRILHIMATSGIIGFMSIGLFWIYITYLIVKRSLKPNSENIFWILFGAFFISYFIYSMFNFSVLPIFLQVMLLVAFLARSEQGFAKKDDLEIDLSKESKEQSFVKDSLATSLVIILPIIGCLGCAPNIISE